MQRFTVRGALALGDRLRPGAVIIEDGLIVEVTRQQDDWALPAPILDSPIIAPGYIDLQVNGGFGIAVGDDPAALQALAAKLPSTGVTSWLPTVITSPPAFYRDLLAAFPAPTDLADGARILGLHLEGPFLSPARKGAHRAEWMEEASDSLFDELAGSNAVRLMTIAPERPAALDRIRRLREAGIIVSLGHTNATVTEFTAGIDAGATMATHLFNAMSPFGHREPGAIGAVLTDDRVTAGLIADGVHSHPAALRLALRAKGPERIALVTDMMAAAGMPPGTYTLGDQLCHHGRRLCPPRRRHPRRRHPAHGRRRAQHGRLDGRQHRRRNPDGHRNPGQHPRPPRPRPPLRRQPRRSDPAHRRPRSDRDPRRRPDGLPAMTTTREKVVAYITHTDPESGRLRLLVFTHPDAPEAGIQVPAGTIKPGESPSEAVLREAEEETGLTDLELVRFLGERTIDFRPWGRDEFHHRHFFHLRVLSAPPDTWLHHETDPDGSSGHPPIPFSFYWVPLPDGVPDLIGEQGALLAEIVPSLKVAIPEE